MRLSNARKAAALAALTVLACMAADASTAPRSAYVPPTPPPTALDSGGATAVPNTPASASRATSPTASSAGVLSSDGATAAGGETAAAPTGPRTHKVAEGETLSLLAFKYYGSPNKWDRIFNANRGKLKSADQVRPGIVLVIP